jgi:hypothetical protein
MSALQAKIVPLLDVHQLLMLFAGTLTYPEPETFTLITFIICYNCYYYYYYYYYYFIVYFLFTFLYSYVFSPVLACDLPLILCCIAPQCNYFYVHCAVSVIGLTAVDSAHK